MSDRSRLSDRLARHEEAATRVLLSGEALELPAEQEIRDEVGFLEPKLKGPSLSTPIKAETEYIGAIIALVSKRHEADRHWADVGISPGDLTHRERGLAYVDEIMGGGDGLSDTFLETVASDNPDAAVLLGMRRMTYQLVTLDQEMHEWWAEERNEERLEEALTLLEGLQATDPEAALKMFESELLARSVVEAMMGGGLPYLLELAYKP